MKPQDTNPFTQPAKPLIKHTAQPCGCAHQQGTINNPLHPYNGEPTDIIDMSNCTKGHNVKNPPVLAED